MVLKYQIINILHYYHAKVNFFEAEKINQLENPKIALDITAIREHFPALKCPAIFLDNPGGTQIVQQGINRMNAYLVEHNANFHGVFRISRETPLENSGQSLES